MTILSSTAANPVETTVEADSAWRKVVARDASAEGEFVYAVTSTGVYCRPGCPSRRPARENTQFFSTSRQAEAAGFRACLRCQPELGPDRSDPQAEAVRKAAALLRTSESKTLEVDELARAVGLSRFALLRGFRRVLGVTPSEYARAQRRERFREQLKNPPSTVTEAVYAAGYGSSSRLYETARDTLGMQPATMKAGGAGERIRWTTATCPLGTLLVAATQRGLCAVLFGDSDSEVEDELKSRFAKATLQRDDAGLADEVREVLAQLSETPAAASLPFDVRATSFQHRVWEALRRIPRGEMRSYSEIAQEIGSPRAVRAVGAACGANPLAVVVPCHRAVAADGRLTGYRWGVERKRRLLALERGGA